MTLTQAGEAERHGDGGTSPRPRVAVCVGGKCPAVASDRSPRHGGRERAASAQRSRPPAAASVPAPTSATCELTVTREFGAVPVLDTSSVAANESDTVMRVLEGEADDLDPLRRRLRAVDRRGAEGTARRRSLRLVLLRRRGRVADRRRRVRRCDGGERIWWDYRDWAATNHVPAVVGSWPAPFSDGYEGKRHPVVGRVRMRGLRTGSD